VKTVEDESRLPPPIAPPFDGSVYPCVTVLAAPLQMGCQPAQLLNQCASVKVTCVSGAGPPWSTSPNHSARTILVL